MKAMILLGCSLAASMAVLPTAASAQQTPQVKVKVDDLDLTKDAGVRTAQRRLNAAIPSQCPDEGRDLQSQRAARDCRNEMLTRGRGRINAAATKADADKLAEQRHLAEVSIHPRRVRRASAYHRTPGQVAAVKSSAHRPVAHAKPTAHRAARHGTVKRHVVVRHTTKTQYRKR